MVVCDCTQFRVFMRHPKTNEMVERKIEVHKDKTLRDATLEAYKVVWVWLWVWLCIQCACLWFSLGP